MLIAHQPNELLLAVDAVPKVLPLDIRHDVVQQSIHLARIEQREEVRMLEVRRYAYLAEKTLNAQYRAKFGVEDFEGDQAFVPDVPSEIDRRHAAAADLTVDGVARGESVGE